MTKKQTKKGLEDVKDIKDVESNTSQISKLTQEVEDLKNGWRRTQADFENYQKRTETQKLEMIELAKADFMTKLMPVLDNFRRSFQHEPDKHNLKNWVMGVEHIEKQLEDILNSEGLIKIKTDIGYKFDPNLHEAISCEKNYKIAADHIIAEIESGWLYKDKVLKPSKVRVSKGK